MKLGTITLLLALSLILFGTSLLAYMINHEVMNLVYTITGLILIIFFLFYGRREYGKN